MIWIRVRQLLVKCWSSGGDVLVNGWSRAGHADSMDKIDTIDSIDKIDNVDKFDNIDKIENIDKIDDIHKIDNMD